MIKIVLPLIIVLAATSFYFYTKLNQANQYINYQKSNIQSLTEQIKILREERSGSDNLKPGVPYDYSSWKVLVSKNFPLSLKCPTDWSCGEGWFSISIQGKTQQGVGMDVNISKLNEEHMQRQGSNDASKTEKLISELKAKLKDSEYIPDLKDYGKYSINSIKNIKLQNKNGLYLDTKEANNIIIVEYKGELYEIKYTKIPQGNDPIVELILTSLTFR